MTSARSAELRAVAAGVAERLPEAVREIVLTGSTSRGVADELSDVELLLVTEDLLPLDECVRALEEAGLEDVTTWTPPTGDSWWSGGTRDGILIEAIWWPRPKVEGRLAEILAGEALDHGRLRTAEALVNGVALRSDGALAAWQERLAAYPPSLADAIVADAAELWSGDPPAARLSVLRPGDRFALTQDILGQCECVLRVVFALNRAWEPGWKRLPAQLAVLPVKPERLAERIEEALLEPDGRRALLLVTELAAETVALAPPSPSVVRAREWLPGLLELLR